MSPFIFIRSINKIVLLRNAFPKFARPNAKFTPDPLCRTSGSTNVRSSYEVKRITIQPELPHERYPKHSCIISKQIQETNVTYEIFVLWNVGGRPSYPHRKNLRSFKERAFTLFISAVCARDAPARKSFLSLHS